MLSETSKFRRILVPLALDAGEASALAVAGKLARVDGGTVFLLHVVAEGGEEAAAKRAEDEVRGALEAVGRVNVAADLPREILIGTGDPASVIIDFERVIPADLVVMRTHARVARLRKALGTVTERVVRESLCPVLIVPEAI